jgi:hypothetical protein
MTPGVVLRRGVGEGTVVPSTVVMLSRATT